MLDNIKEEFSPIPSRFAQFMYISLPVLSHGVEFSRHFKIKFNSTKEQNRRLFCLIYRSKSSYNISFISQCQKSIPQQREIRDITPSLSTNFLHLAQSHYGINFICGYMKVYMENHGKLRVAMDNIMIYPTYFMKSRARSPCVHI